MLASRLAHATPTGALAPITERVHRSHIYNCASTTVYVWVGDYLQEFKPRHWQSCTSRRLAYGRE